MSLSLNADQIDLPLSKIRNRGKPFQTKFLFKKKPWDQCFWRCSLKSKSVWVEYGALKITPYKICKPLEWLCVSAWDNAWNSRQHLWNRAQPKQMELSQPILNLNEIFQLEFLAREVYSKQIHAMLPNRLRWYEMALTWQCIAMKQRWDWTRKIIKLFQRPGRPKGLYFPSRAVRKKSKIEREKSQTCQVGPW